MNNNNNPRRPEQRRGQNPVSFNVKSGTSRNGTKAESGADTFVSTVSGSVAFSATGYEINPGLEDRNLALSKEAQKYDMYEFQELTFRFVRSVAVTTTAGMIGLALDPNPNSSDPAALNRFNAYEHRVMDSVYSPTVLRVPRSALAGWRFVRCGPLGTDLSLYDVGRLVVATQDEADTSKVGFVEMHYKVRFKHYHLEPATPIPHSLSIFNLSSAQTIGTGSAATILYDESIVDGLSLTSTLTSGVFTLPCGQFKITAEMSASDTATEAFQAKLELEKDSLALSPPVLSYSRISPSGTYGYVHVSLTGYVTSDGTATLRVRATLTGAAGTLQAMVDATRITIEALT